jgi:hypothetical protein
VKKVFIAKNMYNGKRSFQVDESINRLEIKELTKNGELYFETYKGEYDESYHFTGTNALYKLDLKTDNEEQLFSHNYYGELYVSDDGQKIVHFDKVDGKDKITILNLKDSKEKVIELPSGDYSKARNVSLSPDGKRIAFHFYTNYENTMIIDIESGKVKDYKIPINHIWASNNKIAYVEGYDDKNDSYKYIQIPKIFDIGKDFAN